MSGAFDSSVRAQVLAAMKGATGEGAVSISALGR